MTSTGSKMCLFLFWRNCFRQTESDRFLQIVEETDEEKIPEKVKGSVSVFEGLQNTVYSEVRVTVSTAFSLIPNHVPLDFFSKYWLRYT